MRNLLEKFQELEFREDVLPILIKILAIVVIFIIGLSVGKSTKNKAYKEKISALQTEITNLQSQKESYVSVNNTDSLIMVLIDDDYRFLTTSEFETIAESLPEMKARKFVLVDLKSNKKIIELESQKLNNIYQEIGKMEALTDPDYYVKNLKIFPELATKKASIEAEYNELAEKVKNGTISDSEKKQKEKEIKDTVQEINTEYPVNGYHWVINNGIIVLVANAA